MQTEKYLFLKAFNDMNTLKSDQASLFLLWSWKDLHSLEKL